MKASVDEAALADALARAQILARTLPTGGDWRAHDAAFANIAARYNDEGSLVLLSYTDRAVHAGVWTPLERLCRGLILDVRDGAVVARGWPKFFNWGELDEDERQRLAALPPLRISEKLDGSLILLFWFGGRWRTATRGSFVSAQARHAQALVDGPGFLTAHLPRRGWTYLCELIAPANRVVLDYGQREELVLLDIMHNGTGMTLSPPRVRGTPLDVGFGEVATVDGADLDRLHADLAVARGVEGWVVGWADGTMAKFKTAWYLDLHRLVSGFSPERVREALLQRRFAEYRATLPEEFWAQCDDWRDEIGRRLDRHATILGRLYDATLAVALDHGGTRKVFADLVLASVNPASRWALFMLYDGKQIEERLLARLDLADLGAAAFDTWKGGADGGPVDTDRGDEQPDLGAGEP